MEAGSSSGSLGGRGEEEREVRLLTVEDLTDDLLGNIFAREDGEGFPRLMEVCKRWGTVVRTAKRTLTLPSWFSPRLSLQQLARFPSLRVLTLEGSRGIEFGWVAFFTHLGQACKQLQELNLISVERRLTQAEITVLATNLTTLVALSLTRSIWEADTLSLHNLPSLETLRVDDASFGSEVQREIARSTALRTLTLTNVTGIPDLQSVTEALPNLHHVELRNLGQLSTLPSFNGFSSLYTLKLSDPHCNTVVDSLHFCNVPGLRSLTLDAPIISTPSHPLQPPPVPLPLLSPSGLVSLDGLRDLEVRGLVLHPLKDLSYLSKSLERLTVTIGEKRTPLSLTKLTALRELCILEGKLDTYARSLCSPQQSPFVLPTLEGLSRLTLLHLGINSQFCSYKHVQERLEDLSVDACGFGLQQIERYTALARLSLHWCCGRARKGELSSALGRLPSLRALNLLANTGDREAPPNLGAMPVLEQLRIVGFCRGAFSLLESFPRLTLLHLDRCSRVRVDSLAGAAASLKELSFTDGKSEPSWDSSPPYVSAVPALQGEFPSLREIQVHRVRDFAAFPELLGLPSLRVLSLVELGDLLTVRPLVGLPKLHTLQVCRCPKVTALPELSGLPSLCVLDVSECSSLTELPSLSGLSDLRAVNLSGCDFPIPDRAGLSEHVDIIKAQE